MSILVVEIIIKKKKKKKKKKDFDALLRSNLSCNVEYDIGILILKTGDEE